ncbi:thiamine biosynthesis protein ThiS [Aliidiomarina sedimenti]|uniref:Thiamine biosynthesis protein ThiS n=1 Tax=Aliidiomarina sedimenti TaxID=1933879 RepID=A0ABY0BXR5_9GAMM|nr:sulfur carrier protein ThiS [Aliidiomarina sedimenti]RUO29269.1 thiamine biosynthesis protein ThiS [Aliidiomarina sedimenti]
MFIYINQHAIACGSDDTLAKVIRAYCDDHQLHFDEVAVAHNDSLVPRSQWAQQRIVAEQRFSLFSAVAGG